jgi:hypothetical protein
MFSKSCPKITSNVLVLASPGACRKIMIRKLEANCIILDLCVSWVGSRFGRYAGIRNRIKGVIESFILLVIYMRFRKRLVITYISSRDRETDRLLFRRRPKYVFPNDLIEILPKRSVEKSFVFVGDPKFRPNRLAIKDLTAALIRARWEAPKIKVFGGGWSKIVDGRFFECMPLLSDENLYRTGDIHLIPTRRGFGIKNKLVIHD